MGWYGPQSGDCSCCPTPCPPISYCKCDNDNSDLPCVTVTFDDATLPDLLCPDTEPGGGLQHVMDALAGEYTIACGDTLCIADELYYQCYAFNGLNNPKFYITIKLFYDSGTGQVCLQIYVLCQDESYFPVRWMRREAKVCWEFAVTSVDGCPYRSCTPTLLSAQFGCTDQTAGSGFTTGRLTCDDLPSSEAISDGRTCADVMTGSYHMADLLPTLTSMTFGISVTSCP